MVFTWSFDVSSRPPSTYIPPPSYIIPSLSQILFFPLAFYSLIFAIGVGSLHGFVLAALYHAAIISRTSTLSPSSVHPPYPPCFDPLLRCSFRSATIAQVFYKIYVCRRARNGYGWPVIYFSTNCNFSNTYRPPDKCTRLFLTRLKNTTPASTAFLQISSPPPVKERS